MADEGDEGDREDREDGEDEGDGEDGEDGEHLDPSTDSGHRLSRLTSASLSNTLDTSRSVFQMGKIV